MKYWWVKIDGYDGYEFPGNTKKAARYQAYIAFSRVYDVKFVDFIKRPMQIQLAATHKRKD